AWLGLPAGLPVPELPEALSRRLLRVEEYESGHRDQWGNWEFGFCEAYRAGKLWEPEIDRWLAERRHELAATVELAPPWPDGHTWAICLTPAVDFVGRASTPRQVLRSARLSLAGPAGSGRDRLARLARPGVRVARAAYNGISAAPPADTLER